MAKRVKMICPSAPAEYFLREVPDNNLLNCPSGAMDGFAGLRRTRKMDCFVAMTAARDDTPISKLLSGTSRKKYSAGADGQIIFTRFAIPARQEGRIAIVTDVGRECGGRRCAFDERH